MPKQTRHARKKPLRVEARQVREAELKRLRLRRNLLTYGSIGVGALVVAVGVGLYVARQEGASGGGAAAGASTPAPAAAPSTTVPDNARAAAPTAPETTACDADTPPQVERETYATPPELALEDGVTYEAVVETSCGEFTIRFDPEVSPRSVNSMIFLAREGFYDSTWFHRMADAPAIIQGGDPQGDGQGGPGYQLEDEFPADTSRYTKYTVAMAKSTAPNTTGSQFFINTGDNTAGLDPAYNFIGEVVDGTEVIDRIADVPRGGPTGETPTEAVWIEKMTIRER